ncbi:nucleoside-diphosphate kinase [Thermincola ferriacetica]|uniref:Nucleoside diphosphate kinase n=1 Tax=Thermincola ferriacetica TaxID=281456 RepID=A0A0L6W0F0_9FIRM|nr:nucleoside-diphosphate kinase [Thermincola ferriacetica]KNZ68878.1 nucleoside-diphosphate kinase [Thermincola ferriacetica]
MERTYVMIKPDGVQRNLIGEIITRFERKGLKIVGLKMLQMDRAMAEKHYAEHTGKPFFEGLVSYITSGPVVAMVLEGKDVVATARAMNGATNPANAGPGTIRGDYAIEVGRNVIHASDSIDSANREIAIYFTESELCEYKKVLDDWIYE